MNKHNYEDRVTEEDILAAEKKFPLADVSMLKMTILMLTLMFLMFSVAVFIL